jgi:hypothetical protein
MWTCPISPQNLREVQDSSRYFSLKIASDINSGEGTRCRLPSCYSLFFYFFFIINMLLAVCGYPEICLGIAFYTKDDSTAFVAKLYVCPETRRLHP